MKPESIIARCLMCGKSYDLTSDHKDFAKLAASQSPEPTFVCDHCGYRVRHEADEQQKPKKPI
ncbi:MAG: DUF2197 domain-containing protein [Syntrophomonadaceae bacterium]|jgi:DNA-directed RNA polymerase subunit RPC12/RpoP|nr:DUF2197 domain-containing protein [Syntrophomonadaceae bacterium]